jgi:hypothetical protein
MIMDLRQMPGPGLIHQDGAEYRREYSLYNSWELFIDTVMIYGI